MPKFYRWPAKARRQGLGAPFAATADRLARGRAGSLRIEWHYTLGAAPLVDPQPTRKPVLVYPADRRVSPAARFVGESFIEIIADLVERNIWAGHML